MKDPTIKILLLLIAIGLFANAFKGVFVPKRAEAQDAISQSLALPPKASEYVGSYYKYASAYYKAGVDQYNNYRMIVTPSIAVDPTNRIVFIADPATHLVRGYTYTRQADDDGAVCINKTYSGADYSPKLP